MSQAPEKSQKTDLENRVSKKLEIIFSLHRGNVNSQLKAITRATQLANNEAQMSCLTKEERMIIRAMVG